MGNTEPLLGTCRNDRRQLCHIRDQTNLCPTSPHPLKIHKSNPPHGYDKHVSPRYRSSRYSYTASYPMMSRTKVYKYPIPIPINTSLNHQANAQPTKHTHSQTDRERDRRQRDNTTSRARQHNINMPRTVKQTRHDRHNKPRLNQKQTPFFLSILPARAQTLQQTMQASIILPSQVSQNQATFIP